MRFAPLPSELRRQRLLVEQELTTGVQWREDCPGYVGMKVRAVLFETSNAAGRVLSLADRHRRISASGMWSMGADDVLGGDGSDSERLDVVAAIYYAMAHLSETDNESVELDDGWDKSWVDPKHDFEVFADTVDGILLGSRIDWTWEGGKFQQRGNHVLHESVVKPTSTLLNSRPQFSKASAGFEAALSRLSENKPAVAITDASTAVQEFFRALGIEGGSLPDQLNSATNKGVIAPSDRKLLKPFVDWLNAERGSRGNAHQYRDEETTKADAWLVIHVAAALVVRLSDEDARGEAQSHTSRANMVDPRALGTSDQHQDGPALPPATRPPHPPLESSLGGAAASE